MKKSLLLLEETECVCVVGLDGVLNKESVFRMGRETASCEG